MLKKLKQEVFEANMALPENGLVTLTWGNVSAIDRERGLVVIKPSGVKYGKMKASDMVVVDLDGNVVDGDLRPSSDTATHLVLYKAFDAIGGIVHTHSTWATALSQAKMPIPAYGTTHADHFYGEIPCTRVITKDEADGDYEYETGKIIVEAFDTLDPMSVPAVLVACHGPFAWGKDAMSAVENAIVLEAVAKMAHLTYTVSNDAKPLPQALLDRHYFRKHGANSYYGQL